MDLANRFHVSSLGLYITILPVPVGYRYPGYVFWFPFLPLRVGWTRMEKQGAHYEPGLEFHHSCVTHWLCNLSATERSRLSDATHTHFIS